jgi:hypothetical protein
VIKFDLVESVLVVGNIFVTTFKLLIEQESLLWGQRVSAGM